MENSASGVRLIQVRAWGHREAAQSLPAIFGVRRTEQDYTSLTAVQRSIHRRTGLEICGCTQQGTALEGGRPESHHYEVTLGRALRTGGYSVEGSVWVAIPVSRVEAN